MSRFRERFKLDSQDRAYIERTGLEAIREHARGFIVQRLADAHPKNDGRQTPFKGHPVFKAQHATATCCRKCISRRHRIPAGIPLTDSAIEYLTARIMEWIIRQPMLHEKDLWRHNERHLSL